jgi:TRAP transporter TAXI family solute receptor
MAVMYPNTLQVVTRKSSGVTSLSQLKDKTVSIGSPGSGTAYMTELVLGSLGIDRATFSERRLSFVENANALRDGSIDVGVWCVAHPTSTLMDLSTTHDITLVPFTEEEQRKVTAEYPFYWTYEVPAGVYRGVETATPTLNVWNVIICTASLDADLVYDLTRTLFEQNEYLCKIHPFARFTTAENTVQHSPIPLHPGAVRLLREKGLEIPERLVR